MLNTFVVAALGEIKFLDLKPFSPDDKCTEITYFEKSACKLCEGTYPLVSLKR
jgi:hypothetical protein